MYIIKRNGSQVDFDKTKIINAIQKANKEVSEKDKITDEDIERIALDIENQAKDSKYAFNVEEIQNKVEDSINNLKKFELGRTYSTYRFKQAEKRNKTALNEKIKAIVDFKSEEIKQENSNKNPHIAPTQRDYMAGEISKEITMSELLPPDIVKAHEAGIIHFHDADYFANHIYNCSLPDINDMLQNGTVISGTKIDKPKSFLTACNIKTQCMAQIASSQYGGQSMTLSALVPFVDISRQKIKADLLEDYGLESESELKGNMKELFYRQVEHRLRNEIIQGVQTMQYQILTLLTTNGQTPFVTLFMYLDEVEEGQARDDLAMIIKEVLRQRMKGIKNESGEWITPAFPKLIYVLDEDNIHEDSKYYNVTVLAAKCTAKRMVPDYISAKKLKEYKDGYVYPCMGCVDGKEVITYKINDKLYVESFERMWDRISLIGKIKTQKSSKNDKYIDLFDLPYNVTIYDKKEGFVKVKRLIRNLSSNWVRVTMKNGRELTCTDDHPFHTENRGRVLAKDLNWNDVILFNRGQYVEEKYVIKTSLAYQLGEYLCYGWYPAYDKGSFSIKSCDDAKIIDSAILKYFDKRNDDVFDPNLSNGLRTLFGGAEKDDRHIPEIIFTVNKEARCAFIAGVVEAIGEVDVTHANKVLSVKTENKELALQLMALIQSVGYPVFYYEETDVCEPTYYNITTEIDDSFMQYLRHGDKTTVYDEEDPMYVPDITSETGNVDSVYKLDMTEYSYDVTTESDHFDVSGIYSHNCRSFLTSEPTVLNPDGTRKFYGRFNQGVVTINLPDVALSSHGDFDKFWEIYEERLELCHKALRLRHERLLGTPSDVAPILWQYGAIARLKKGEKIDKLLYGGYSTISLGYAGLYECVKYMTGKSHTDEEAKPFALSVMQKLNDKCAEWRAAENIAYSVYGTPIESTTYKFAKCLQQRFGIIEGITDHNYITNSYHVNVREKINAFDKLAFEAEFQKLSPGGAISYIETPDLQDNIESVLQVMKFIYDTIVYAELNTKSDYCQVCGSTHEIKIIEEENTGKLIWECPCCGNRDQSKMNVARRTCGYIGTQFWNQGRTEEIKERVIHLDNELDE